MLNNQKFISNTEPDIKILWILVQDWSAFLCNLPAKSKDEIDKAG